MPWPPRGEALGWGQQGVEKEEADWISWGTCVSDADPHGPHSQFEEGLVDRTVGSVSRRKQRCLGDTVTAVGARSPCGARLGHRCLLEGEGQPTSLP